MQIKTMKDQNVNINRDRNYKEKPNIKSGTQKYNNLNEKLTTRVQLQI